MQGGLQQRQPQVEELEKELARLKQDGQAYREDLTQQLEAAKQAATQARHDAAQASSQAAHGANQVQLLQSDRARMAEMADSWRKQAHENQVWFASGVKQNTLFLIVLKPHAEVCYRAATSRHDI